MSKHRLTVLWADDSLTILDLPSKAAAIDWLATHDSDRPILTASIIPVADDDVLEEEDSDG
jgi:hypothetical protein